MNTKTLISRIPRNVFALADQGVVSAASFATAMMLGRFGSREDLGVYALALTILMLMVNVQGELITAPYTLFRQRRDQHDVPHYTGSVMLHELFVMLIAMILFGLLAAGSAFGAGPASLQYPMVVLLLAGPCWMARGFVRYISFANHQFGTALAVDVATAIIQISLLFYLLNTGQLNANTTFAAMGIACAATCCAWWFARRLPTRFALERVLRDLRENWSFSRWALASQLIGCVTPYMLPWILARTRGEADTGTFAACTNLCGIATTFVVGLALALTPQAARAFATGGKASLIRILMRTATMFAMGVGAFCVATVFFGEVAMTFVYGPSFAGTHVVVILLGLAVFTNSFSIISGNGLWAVNRPEANLIADITVLLVTLVSAALLVHSYGVVGAASATLIGSAAGAITRLLVFRRVLSDVTRVAVTN